LIGHLSQHHLHYIGESPIHFCMLLMFISLNLLYFSCWLWNVSCVKHHYYSIPRLIVWILSINAINILFLHSINSTIVLWIVNNIFNTFITKSYYCNQGKWLQYESFIGIKSFNFTISMPRRIRIFHKPSGGVKLMLWIHYYNSWFF